MKAARTLLTPNEEFHWIEWQGCWRSFFKVLFLLMLDFFLCSAKTKQKEPVNVYLYLTGSLLGSLFPEI